MVYFPMPGRWQFLVIFLSIVWQLILITEYFSNEEVAETLEQGNFRFCINIISMPIHRCTYADISLCTYQCLAPTGGGRAYPGAIDIFENKMSIIPT